MKLKVLGYSDQVYDIYQHPKESFRCVYIKDQDFNPDVRDFDSYTKHEEHLKNVILPAIQKKLPLNNNYMIFSIDSYQGEMFPHLLVCRKDYEILKEKDKKEIESLFNALDSKIELTRFFKQKGEAQHSNVQSHYFLRHNKQ